MPESTANSLRLAGEALGRGEAWLAATRLRQALGRNERLGSQWVSAVRIAERIADDHAAVLAARRLWEETGGGPAGSFLLAEALTTAGRADEAVALLVPVTDRGLLSPDQTFKLTRMLMFAGLIEEAQARCRELLRAHPDSPTLWERIASTKRYAAGDPDIAAMQKVFRRSAIARPVGRSAIASALAKAFVDIGDDNEAARYLEARAEANRARFPFDPRTLHAGLADVLAWCGSGRSDPAGPASAGSSRPIFILGPARSGTSLLDQIFARHSGVRGGGELRHFWLATRELGDCSTAAVDAFDQRAAAGPVGPGPWEEFGRRYLLLADERFGLDVRFTDKLLSNVHRVRAILRALPQARIVCIRRNPLDVAWSCWRTQFDADSAWSSSPEYTALYVICYRRMMTAWSRRYPDSIIEVSYESLVRDPNAEIPRLLQACGLGDEAATRQPELAIRPVSTMSFAQVRMPIHAESVESAARFPLATAALRRAFEAAGASE